MKSSVVWLWWPSKINRRFSVGSWGLVLGKKIFRSHSNAVRLSIQPFFEWVNFQSVKGVKSRGYHCYWIDLPLWMTNGGRNSPVAETHSIKEV